MGNKYRNLPSVNDQLFFIIKQKILTWNDETKKWNDTGVPLLEYNPSRHCAAISLKDFNI